MTVLVALIATVAPASPTGAAGPNGCTSNSTADLQADLDDAACSTVTVEPGSYTGPFFITRDVTVLGANAGVSPNTGSRGTETTIDGLGDGFEVSGTGTETTIDGFRFTVDNKAVFLSDTMVSANVTRNMVEQGDEFLQGSNAVSAVAHDNFVTGTVFSAIRLTDGQAVSITGNRIVHGDEAVILNGDFTTSVLIDGNTIEDPGQAGIDVGTPGVPLTGPVTISGNTITDFGPADEAIDLDFIAGALTVSGNVIDRGPDDAIEIDDAANVTILGNTIRNVAGGGDGIDVDLDPAQIAGPVAIIGNNVTLVEGPGIRVEDSQTVTINGNTMATIGLDGIRMVTGVHEGDVTISGNEIRDPGSEGVDVMAVTGSLVITGNTISDLENDGIQVRDAMTTTISGNTISDGAPNHASGVDLLGITGSVTLEDNRITNMNNHGLDVDDVAGVTARGNVIDTVKDSGIALTSIGSGGAIVTGNFVRRAVTDSVVGDAGIRLDDANGTAPITGFVRIDANTVLDSHVGILVTDVVAPGVLDPNFNRIVGNTYGVRHEGDGPVDFQNNWWGCNEGPYTGAPDCDTISESVPGTVDADPWLVLGISAQGQAITADLTRNSDGDDTSSLGTIPDGTPVTFTTDLGTMDPSATTTTAGKATALLTSSQVGTANVATTVDNETVGLAVPVAPGGTEFYFAEGTTLDGFREYLLLANGGTEAADVDVTYYFDDGSTPLATTVAVPAGGRTTVDVVTVVGADRTGVSIGLSASQPIVAERSIFFERAFPVGVVNGSHSVLGARLAQKQWLFAEGSTLPGFQEYMTLQNPGTADANVTLTYGLEGGGTDSTSIVVPAGQRRTVDVNAEIPDVSGHSTQVDSDQPILAERPMYFTRPVSDDGVVINGGHVAFGSEAAPEWNFAEGNVLADFAEYITLANPDPSASATADITYFFSDGTTQVRTVDVAPASRRTVKVFDPADPGGVGRDVSDPVSRGVSAKVTTTAPGGLVAERPMYFHRAIGGPTEINDGHNKPGAPALSPAWLFAEGSTLPGFSPFLTILNPASSSASITITYTPDTGPPIVRTVTALPTSRLTVQIYGDPSQGGIGSEVTGFGVVVTADQPVLVERPFYVNRQLPGLPVINGGSVVIGFSG